MTLHSLEPGTSYQSNRDLISQGQHLIHALREATRSQHAVLSANRSMARLFASDFTLAEYREHLSRMLGLIEPLEQVVVRLGSPSRSLAYISRRSLDLRGDLEWMGVSRSEIDSIERCSKLPAISEAGLYGYVYVLLGSMLGGRVIVRRLRSQLGPAASFCFYGEGCTGFETAWEDFREELEGCYQPDAASICATASEIFQAFNDWFTSSQGRKDS